MTVRLIRATHRYGFRSGKWARLVTTGKMPVTDSESGFRDVYVVQFADGVVDMWPVDDPSDPYEFSAAD